MIEDHLVVTMSSTSFVDSAGRVMLFPHGGLSLDESQERGLTPLIAIAMCRRMTSLRLYQYQLPNRARLDTFLVSAWAMGCLGGAPKLLRIQPGLDVSLGKQIRSIVRSLCSKTKVDVLISLESSGFEHSTASHTLHLEEGCVDDSFSCEDIIAVGNRRERLDTEMELQGSVPSGTPIKASERKPLFVALEPFLGAAHAAAKGLTDGARWVEYPKANNLVIHGRMITHTDEQVRRMNENAALFGHEERYEGSLSKLRDALRCLPYGHTEAFEESLPEYGVADFLEGDDDISGDMANSIHERMQENNVFFPVTSGQFLAALQIASDDGRSLAAIARVTSRTVEQGLYRFLISAQKDGTTTVYCLPSASTFAPDAWLKQIRCFVGACEILSDAMVALMALVNLPMTAALSRQIPDLIDCFLEEDPEWPNYPKVRINND